MNKALANPIQSFWHKEWNLCPYQVGQSKHSLVEQFVPMSLASKFGWPPYGTSALHQVRYLREDICEGQIQPELQRIQRAATCSYHCCDSIQRWGWTDECRDPQDSPGTLYISLSSSDLCKARAGEAPVWNLRSGNFYIHMDFTECQNLGNGRGLGKAKYPRTPGVEIQNKNVMLIGGIIV